MAELIFREECYKIVGACLEVTNDKGCGFLESVYQECLEIEFDYQQMPFVPRQMLRLLINFGSYPRLEWKRLVHTGKKSSCRILPANSANERA